MSYNVIEGIENFAVRMVIADDASAKERYVFPTLLIGQPFVEEELNDTGRITETFADQLVAKDNRISRTGQTGIIQSKDEINIIHFWKYSSKALGE